MTREYVNVTLTARVEGDRLLLLDCSSWVEWTGYKGVGDE
jgi:hypothetical protein